MNYHRIFKSAWGMHSIISVSVLGFRPGTSFKSVAVTI